MATPTRASGQSSRASDEVITSRHGTSLNCVRNSCIGNIVGVLGSTRPSGGFQEFHHLLLELRLDDGRVQRLSRRFKDGFTTIVPKVLQLVQRNAPLAKIYKEAREEMLAEDLPDSDFRAALILLPHIFKEKVESFITLGESDADTPYPTIQLVETDWKMAFSKRLQVIVKVDGVEVCRGTGVEEGTLAAFSAYYVFNLAYPPYMKNTLTFLQHAIAKIIEVSVARGQAGWQCSTLTDAAASPRGTLPMFATSGTIGTSVLRTWNA
ncbi:hypothetical protein DPEC_G00335370 [Dallia pectoralis]|uniref:Uncharacterized protein n=1 Tax=Dallia pectoralis TaxID=75939 RepID=A0ACC2F6T1_DALPE|nr:hypothetical protein DPEC_G00335370 [Dallia pectoralis]